MQQPILKVSGLTMDFGGIRALNQLDLDVHSGEIAALIGPNGAGKTTSVVERIHHRKHSNGEIK